MGKKVAEEKIPYRCDSPTTREDRAQLRARARSAAQVRLNQENAQTQKSGAPEHTANTTATNYRRKVA